MLIARWDYHHAMYEAMEQAEVIETESFVELTRQYPCAYVVLKDDRETTKPLSDYGFVLYDQVGDYLIYEDQETVQ